MIHAKHVVDNSDIVLSKRSQTQNSMQWIIPYICSRTGKNWSIGIELKEVVTPTGEGHREISGGYKCSVSWFGHQVIKLYT